MQSDRWLISTSSEQEPFSLSAGPVGFPIWIDDDADSAQLEPLPAYSQEDVEDVGEIEDADGQGAQDEIIGGATLPSWPERRYDMPNPATPI
ncbi:MAG TPA: hypothetical protein VGU68_17295, partial [Ktedonobacteraceae bacterium]|nr:hypothetical protein [Ktedonobacteraceae bacterium]